MRVSLAKPGRNREGLPGFSCVLKSVGHMFAAKGVRIYMIRSAEHIFFFFFLRYSLRLHWLSGSLFGARATTKEYLGLEV